MNYKFESQGRAYVLDTPSGSVHELTPLLADLLEYVREPLEGEKMPMSIRYSMAKYESSAVADGYRKLWQWQTEGTLFSPENDDPRSPGEAPENVKTVSVTPDHIDFCDEIRDLADDGETVFALGISGDLNGKQLDDLLDEYELLADEVIDREIYGPDPIRVLDFEKASFREEGRAECENCPAKYFCARNIPAEKSVLCEIRKKQLECAARIRTEM